MEKALIISHVVAGSATLLSGLLAAFLGKKGGWWHRLSGRVFYWSMFWVFISAILLISFVRFSAFLMVIAVFSWYMTFSGVRVLTLRKTLQPLFIDWLAACLTMAFGLFSMGLGLYYQWQYEWASVLGYLCLFFGFFTMQTGWLNFNGFRTVHKAEKMWWWFAHMNSMCGALIASITAFLVQNGRAFDLPSSMSWVPWVFPAMVGLPLVSYWANKYRKKFRVGKYAVGNN
ncbi:hypothetical protein [Roseivirga sp. UBA838]|jgi:hypothetical protein|uniref:hypothetical protein n=1 Tax=Roseivirga sp. UBA838 TaxID=1947393 RepID=UPI00257FEA1C|nr:hypothetical protein [Roseivirga sp. UBA838]|tara:strand:- start:112105 stop:112794 length:690 start_codon:yes stop_codon:yes gene_type:complete